MNRMILGLTTISFYPNIASFNTTRITNSSKCRVVIPYQSVVFAISTAIGFGLALVLFAGIREQLSMTKLPKGMEGTAIALITAGLMAMAFMGFAGIVK